MNEDALNIMAGVREMALLEIAQIDDTSVRSAATAHTALAQLPSLMRAAASRALDTVALADADLAPSSLPATQARLGRCLAGATGDAARTLGVEIQTSTATTLAAQAGRLHDFAVTCDTLLDYMLRTLLRPGAAPPSSVAGALAEHLRASQATYVAASRDTQPAPFRAGDLGAALVSREVSPILATLPLPADAADKPQDLKRAYHTAAHAAINRLAAAEVVSGERAVTNLIAAEFRDLALQIDGFLDAQWRMLSALPTSAFQAAPPIAAPMTYEPTPPVVTPPPSTASLCMHCATELRSGHRFCHVCGAPTQLGAASQPPPAERRAICSNCGALIKPGHRFCGTCGATFTPAASPPPPAGSPVEPVPISPELLQMTDVLAGVRPVCAQCGNVLKPGEKFCGRCGGRMTSSSAVPAGAPHDPRPAGEAVAQPTSTQPSPYTCPRCGVSLDPDARICVSCGLVGPLLSDEEPAAEEASPMRPIAAPPTAISTLPCRRCGSAVEVGAPWCPACGASMPPAPAAASAQAAAAVATPTCPACGAVLRPGIKFCGSCGVRTPV